MRPAQAPAPGPLTGRPRARAADATPFEFHPRDRAEAPEFFVRLKVDDAHSIVKSHLDMRASWAKTCRLNGIPESRIVVPPAPYQDPGIARTRRPPFERSPSDTMSRVIASAKRSLMCDAASAIARLEMPGGQVPASLVDAERITAEARADALGRALMWRCCDLATPLAQDTPLGLEPSTRSLALECARIFLGIPKLCVGHRAGKDGLFSHFVSFSSSGVRDNAELDDEELGLEGLRDLDDEELGLEGLRREDPGLVDELEALPEEDLDEVRGALADLLDLRVASLYVARFDAGAETGGPLVEAGPESKTTRSAGVMLLLRDILRSYAEQHPRMIVEPHRARDWILETSRLVGNGLAELEIPSKRYDPERGIFT